MMSAVKSAKYSPAFLQLADGPRKRPSNEGTRPGGMARRQKGCIPIWQAICLPHGCPRESRTKQSAATGVLLVSPRDIIATASSAGYVRLRPRWGARDRTWSAVGATVFQGHTDGFWGLLNPNIPRATRFEIPVGEGPGRELDRRAMRGLI